VNFAIKTDVARTSLDEYGTAYQTARSDCFGAVHSQKPDAFDEPVEKLCPSAALCEPFARSTRALRLELPYDATTTLRSRPTSHTRT
jgi:hypothetical protein